MRLTVRGLIVTCSVSVRPPWSVTVSLIVSVEGYSWSGAENEPFVVSAIAWATCSWQLLGQWSITICQSKAVAGSVCCASVAVPEKPTSSSTAQVVEPVGATIWATGGGVVGLDRDRLGVGCPSGSLTRTLAVWVPAP